MASLDLKRLVREKIADLGVKEASKFFGRSLGTVSNWSNGKTSPSIDAAELVLMERGLDIESFRPEIPDPYICDPAQLTQWAGRKVMVLLPCYRSFNSDTHYTLFANYAKYGPEKIGMEVVNRTLIQEARGILIDRAMHTDAETFLMADDDMILPMGNAAILNQRYLANLPEKIASEVAFSRIMSHGRDKGIVGCLYFGRHATGKAQTADGFQSDTEDKALHELRYPGLRPQAWVGTGLIKIERWVIEKMKAAVDAGKWPECKPIRKDYWYGYFEKLRAGIGEDVSFGTRASQIGIQSYVDVGLVCGHVGDFNFWPSNTHGH